VNFKDFIKKHPQRATGLFISVFGVVQANLAMFQAHVSPLLYAGLNIVLGIIVTALAWFKDNTPPESV
jgi:hypothetical protein